MSLQSKIMDFLGPRPGLVILRVHQGKVEIILRVILIVLVFFTFVCGAFLLTHLKLPDVPADNPVKTIPEGFTRELADTRTGCQWIIFVCWMAIAVQAVSLTLRFLNLTVVERYIGPVLLVGIILHALFLISWFAAAILFAVHSAHWRSLKKIANQAISERVPFSTIMSAVAGTSCFCFFVLFCEIVLTIWIVMWLVLRWQHLVTQQLQYQLWPSQGDEEDWVPEEV